jgi:hypothetical protein
MKPPTNLTAIIDKKRYSVATATLLAGDDYWDGHNHERHGRNTWLYRSPRGAYFTVTRSQWQGEEAERLKPLSLDEALALYEGPLTVHEVEYASAFPSVTVEDA